MAQAALVQVVLDQGDPAQVAAARYAEINHYGRGQKSGDISQVFIELVRNQA